MPRIDGVLAKIERAEHHIRDFEAAITTFLNSDFYTLRPEPYPEIKHIGIVVESVQAIPPQVPLILGDCVHNLRSALDHLAWQLVEAGGGVPNRDTYFPICQTAQQYSSAIGKGEIERIHPRAQPILKRIQPQPGNNQTLWHIHEIDRIDKHRLLITVACTLNSFWLKNPKIRLIDLSSWQRVEVGHEILRLPEDTYATADGNIDFGTDIAFGDSEILAGDSVLQCLKRMKDHVGLTVELFRHYLD